MSDTRTQIALLLQRAAELRAQGQEIQRKLRQIFAEIARLQARYQPHTQDLPLAGTPQLWRKRPDDTHTPDTHM